VVPALLVVVLGYAVGDAVGDAVWDAIGTPLVRAEAFGRVIGLVLLAVVTWLLLSRPRGCAGRGPRPPWRRSAWAGRRPAGAGR
jgi:hypothetical protein